MDKQKQKIRAKSDYKRSINGNLKRNASYQEIPIKPVYIHRKPTQILPTTKVKMVYVMPKFTISKKEKIKVQLLDIFKAIPSVGIFMLPGGALLLPLVIKLIPDILPSAFQEDPDDFEDQ